MFSAKLVGSLDVNPERLKWMLVVLVDICALVLFTYLYSELLLILYCGISSIFHRRNILVRPFVVGTAFAIWMLQNPSILRILDGEILSQSYWFAPLLVQFSIIYLCGFALSVIINIVVSRLVLRTDQDMRGRTQATLFIWSGAYFLISMLIYALTCLSQQNYDVTRFRSLRQDDLKQLQTIASDDSLESQERIEAILAISGLGTYKTDFDRRRGMLDTLLKQFNEASELYLASRISLAHIDTTIKIGPVRMDYFPEKSVQELLLVSDMELISGNTAHK